MEQMPQVLRKFVQQVLDDCIGQERPLTINDLLRSIRGVRMSEISEWPNSVLDTIEVHAVQFDGHAPLDSILASPVQADASCAVSVSSICAPSPFAWT